MLTMLKLPKFYSDDQVWLSHPTSRALLGPYLISSVDTSSKPTRYILCNQDGTLLNNGSLVEERALQRVEQ